MFAEYNEQIDSLDIVDIENNLNHLLRIIELQNYGLREIAVVIYHLKLGVFKLMKYL